MANETRKMPSSAFNLAASAFQLSGDPVKLDSGVTKYPVKMLARGVDPIPHWYFGTLANELTGLKHKDSIPIDHVHDQEQILGALDKFEIQSDGLHVSGYLVSTQPGDKAETIAKQMAAGVPYEASIDFSGYPYKIEKLGAGQTATVNGRQMTGPGYIFRESPLRGVALCPYGADQSTSSSLATLSAFAPQIEIEVLTQESPMAETPASPSAADSQAGSPVTKTPEQLAVEKAQAEKLAADQAADKLSILKKLCSFLGFGDAASLSVPEHEAGKGAPVDKLALLDKLTAEFGAEIAVKALKAENPVEEAARLKAASVAAEIETLRAENAKLSAQGKGGKPAGFTDPSNRQKLSFAEACFGGKK